MANDPTPEDGGHWHTTADGRSLPAIPYGSEADDWGADRQPCHDCGVLKGEYHFPGCGVERCPNCAGQLASCYCDFEGDEGEDEGGDEAVA